MVVHVYSTSHNKVHCLDARLIADNGPTRQEDTTVQLNNEFIDEALLALLEESAEVAFEALEVLRLLYELSLQLRRDLVKEGELLDDQVVIETVRHVYVHFDVAVQLGLYEERLITLLDLLDPHVQLVELLVNLVLEVVRCIEDLCDVAHEQREEHEAHELHENRVELLVGRCAREVTVANSRDDLKYPVERKDVLGDARLISEAVRRQALIKPAVSAPDGRICLRGTVVLLTEQYPYARHDVIQVDHEEDDVRKADDIALPLLAEIVQNELEQQL